MTRINVLPVEDLGRLTLQGEYKEITRPIGLVKKAISRGVNKYNFKQKIKQPSEYTLGTGHVKFFYNKLSYIADRYEQLCDEMRSRGYNPNQIPREELLKGIDKFWLGGYNPTEQAIKINRERILQRNTGV